MDYSRRCDVSFCCCSHLQNCTFSHSAYFMFIIRHIVGSFFCTIRVITWISHVKSGFRSKTSRWKQNHSSSTEFISNKYELNALNILLILLLLDTGTYGFCQFYTMQQRAAHASQRRRECVSDLMMVCMPRTCGVFSRTLRVWGRGCAWWADASAALLPSHTQTDRKMSAQRRVFIQTQTHAHTPVTSVTQTLVIQTTHSC